MFSSDPRINIVVFTKLVQFLNILVRVTVKLRVLHVFLAIYVLVQMESVSQFISFLMDCIQILQMIIEDTVQLK